MKRERKSDKVDSKANSLLRNPKASKTMNSVAASALTQANNKRSRALGKKGR